MVRGMNRAEYSTRAEPASGAAIGHVLAGAARAEAGNRRRLRAPAALESWPGIVHGGGLVALMDLAARTAGGPGGPRTLEGRLTSPVPSETALALEARVEPGLTALAITRDGQSLASGVLSSGVQPPPPAPWRGGQAGDRLPMSDRCLACGSSNPVGLHVGLCWDGEGVWARLEPPASWLEAGGRLHPALAPVLLDEVAWWLGALTMGEGGLTNRIAIAWRDPAAAVRGAVVAAGRLGDVTAVDRKRTFWRTAPALLTEEGEVLATASIVFRGGREYSSRQLDYFRPRTPPEVFARMFPRYAG
jgi:hypothetical protein